MTGARSGMCALAAGMALSAGVHAAGEMSKQTYQDGNQRIAAEMKAAKDACRSLSGNANDVCMKEASARATIAKAELKVAYQPDAKNSYDASVKKAQAEYLVARERCDDAAGNVKDVCLKQAKAVEVGAKADARERRKIATANSTADRKSWKASSNAASDKRDAEYAVAKERCGVFAREAKTRCLDDAKVAFGKS
jgi:hypothetical protein